jgi:ubiquitin-protein ligase
MLDCDFDDDDETREVETEAEEPQYQIEKREDEKAMTALFQQYKPTNSAQKRLLFDFRAIQKTKPSEIIFTASPVNENLFHWEIRIDKFFDNTNLKEEIKRYKNETGRDYLEALAIFPPDYPFKPPFFQFIQPRLNGGYISNGAICNDILTYGAWSSSYDCVSVFTNLFAFVFSHNPTIDFSNRTPYSRQEAINSYNSLWNSHKDWGGGYLPSE